MQEGGVVADSATTGVVSFCDKMIGVLEQVVAADADEDEGLGDEISRRPASASGTRPPNEAREVPDLLGHGNCLATLRGEQNRTRG